MYCISISHKATPATIRELFACSKEEQVEFGNTILKLDLIRGLVMISTCNRFEIYVSGDESTIDSIQAALCKFKQISLVENKKFIYVYSNERAIHHLFQVACGLDSMVLGEDEILGQVKDAYAFSLEHQFTDTQLNMAFQGAISCSKLTKTDTLLSNIPVSIGTLTANCASDFLKKNNAKNVLIIGITGKMGSIVAKNLIGKGDYQLIGFHRNHKVTNELVTYSDHIKLVNYKDRMQYLSQADVIISATTSPHYTLTYHEVSQILKDNEKEKLFLDLAIPFDIDKDIANINHCKLLDIDYFKTSSEENNLAKMKEYEKVELIMEAKLEDTIKNIYVSQYQSVIRETIDRVNTQGIGQLFYHIKNELTSEQLKALLHAMKNA